MTYAMYRQINITTCNLCVHIYFNGSFSVETAWHYIESSPPVPAAILEAIIRKCAKDALSPHVVLPNIIKIAEGTFKKMLSLQLCPREYFALTLKFFSSNNCNTQ